METKFNMENYLGIPSDYKGPVNFATKVLSLIPGLGWKRAGKIASYFPDIQVLLHRIGDAAYSGKVNWCEIPGIGESTSAKINQYLKQQGQS